jgi:hypothetical protein
MAAQARKIDVIYAETGETVTLVATIGDAIRGEDWARKQYPDDPATQEDRGNIYAIYLAAKRNKLLGSSGDWLEWLDQVTFPDAEYTEEPSEGEADGPPSAS